MVAKWSRLDWSQRLVLFEAACYLLAAQIAVHLLPFRWVAPHLGNLGEPTSETQISQEQQRQAQQVGWAVTALARYFPWDAKCLAQAVAGKWMLQRRGLPNTLYLGVDRVHGGDKWLEAHAWLRCGTDIVTGEPEHERFKVLATFTEYRQ
jgi:hypothetical protein